MFVVNIIFESYFTLLDCFLSNSNNLNLQLACEVPISMGRVRQCARPTVPSAVDHFNMFTAPGLAWFD